MSASAAPPPWGIFADVAVVGAGAAGLAAAVAAGEAGARVVLVNPSSAPGGTLRYGRSDAAGEQGARELTTLSARLSAVPNVTVLNGAVCEGLFADNWLAVVQGRRLHKLRAGRVILATGALDQPAVFRGNDLPGTMLGSAAQRLIRGYGVRPRPASRGADGERRGLRRCTRSCRGRAWKWRPSSICAASHPKGFLRRRRKSP